jgi:hypothetical protein
MTRHMKSVEGRKQSNMEADLRITVFNTRNKTRHKIIEIANASEEDIF